MAGPGPRTDASTYYRLAWWCIGDLGGRGVVGAVITLLLQGVGAHTPDTGNRKPRNRETETPSPVSRWIGTGRWTRDTLSLKGEGVRLGVEAARRAESSGAPTGPR